MNDERAIISTHVLDGLRPVGVSWRIAFFVGPIHRRVLNHRRGPSFVPCRETQKGGAKEALLATNNHRFKISPLVVPDNEAIACGTLLAGPVLRCDRHDHVDQLGGNANASTKAVVRAVQG